MHQIREGVPAHWDAQSQAYAGGDHLVTALHAGWTIHDTIYRESHFRRTCCVTVYHFTLHKGNQTLTMPVIANPFVEQFIVLRQLIAEPIKRPTYPMLQRLVA